MDRSYRPGAPSDNQLPPLRPGGFMDNSHTVNRPPPLPEPAQWSTQQGHAAPRWGDAPGYIGPEAGFLPSTPAGVAGLQMAPPYGFDHLVAPPPFGCRYFPNTASSASINTYGGLMHHGAGPELDRYASQSGSGTTESLQPNHESLCPPSGQNQHHRQYEDKETCQRRQDTEWLRRFIQSRRGGLKQQPPPAPPHHLRGVRETLYGAARLVSALQQLCETLKQNVHSHSEWTDSYQAALDVKRDLQDKVDQLTNGDGSATLTTKVSRVGRRRARRRRARTLLQLEEQTRLEHISLREAAIDTWRRKKIHEVEERKKEQELKLAADSVLCEVRKKQSDVKRMCDVLRSLEKLRKLRKEAASRKGIATEQGCDEAFASLLEQLRTVMKSRTAVYLVEEKALMVMLEGEQEQERKREQEKRAKKDKERQLQQKQRVDAMLFGDERPADSVLQPFTEYFTQAQHSLHHLLQIRREWDAFVVAADHPDGSLVPQTWILPEPPSDQNWASFLQTVDTV